MMDERTRKLEWIQGMMDGTEVTVRMVNLTKEELEPIWGLPKDEFRLEFKKLYREKLRRTIN